MPKISELVRKQAPLFPENAQKWHSCMVTEINTGGKNGIRTREPL